MIITADSVAHEQQEARCREALRMIDVPANVRFALHGPLLFQLAHLCCVIDQPMHYTDALRWMHDHRGEILKHAEEIEIKKNEERRSSAQGTD